MRKSVQEQIQAQVKDSYADIAAQFSETRKKPWGEFHHFLAYVRRGAKVLDVGCGNGRLYDFLQQKDVQYLGVDNNSALLEQARKEHPDARFELMDMIDLDLEKGAFDNVFAIASFHHIPSKKLRKQSLKKMHTVLKDDGVLVLTVWNLFQKKYIGAVVKAFFWWLLHLGFKYAWNDTWIKWANAPKKRYYHAFTPRELRGYFDDNAWQVEEFYFTRHGKRVSFFRSFNLVVIARKREV